MNEIFLPICRANVSSFIISVNPRLLSASTPRKLKAMQAFARIPSSNPSSSTSLIPGYSFASNSPFGFTDFIDAPGGRDGEQGNDLPNSPSGSQGESGQRTAQRNHQVEDLYVSRSREQGRIIRGRKRGDAEHPSNRSWLF